MPKVQADGLPLPQRYGAILTIVIGISMAVLDGAIANVALPTIATDLHATPASSIWVVNAYQIAIVISLLSFSFLGDMFGYRRIYKCGLVVFLLSSLFCALSDSLQMLTLARVIQGFGGAALMSVNTALIRLIYPQRFLGRGMGINSFIVAVSSAAGPTIAAAILSIASWKWLFLINVPLGIIALLLAMRFLPPNGSRASKPRFDLPSAVMNALTFGLLITALSGFAQAPADVNCCGTGGNGRWWYFLYSPPAFLSRTAATGGFSTAIPLFHFRSAHLFALSAHKCWQWFPLPFTCKPCLV
ncbi:MFS transporter [Shigella flexneri]